MHRLSSGVFGFVLLVGLAFGSDVRAGETGLSDTEELPEPNVEIASAWWTETENVWTPVGWKDHLFRFTVYYNGTIEAKPHPEPTKKYTEPWEGLGVQLTCIPANPDGTIPRFLRIPTYTHTMAGLDGGVGNQGWDDDHATPVLWTEWRRGEGVILRQSIFGHIAGAGDVETGHEPLYGWIRLSVEHVTEVQGPKHFGFMVKINAPHIGFDMAGRENLVVHPEASRYPRRLTAEMFGGGSPEEGQRQAASRRDEPPMPDIGAGKVGQQNLVFPLPESAFPPPSERYRGCYLLEAGGKVRLAVAPGQAVMTRFIDRAWWGKDYWVHVVMPARVGAHVDLLVPFIPTDRAAAETELSLGYDRALAESDQYWSVKPATAAVIDTPERYINDVIQHMVKFAEIIAEKSPTTGQYTFLSGSRIYARLWSASASMNAHMLLDPLGYHEVVEKHIELFRQEQGTVKPPGPSYRLHPGYFATPKSLTANDWLTDHGAILHEVCEHALFTGDREFIDHWLDAIIKACEFIRDARAITGHDGVVGLLPPAVASDREVPTQAVWSDGWNYKGLSTAVRLLKRIGHARAEEFDREAHDYKQVFVKAFRERTSRMPRWTDVKGQRYPVVPTSLSVHSNIHHAFHLDGGPMSLVWFGLMDASDDLMRTAVRYHREGPNTSIYNPNGTCWQRPVLIHEISSCEPGYSWTFFHNHQLGDRYRYLEGMYSLLTCALSRGTHICCETRHGIHGRIAPVGTISVYLVRLCVIDDFIEPDALHLLRFVPKAWLKTNYLTKFENMATEFGPVTLRFQLAEAGKALKLSYEPSFRHRPEKVVLHVPPVAGLSRMIINGRVVEARPGERLVIKK